MLVLGLELWLGLFQELCRLPGKSGLRHKGLRAYRDRANWAYRVPSALFENENTNAQLHKNYTSYD
jgi:hypothetical protein